MNVFMLAFIVPQAIKLKIITISIGIIQNKNNK